MPSAHGSSVPAPGAYSPAVTRSVRLGSIARTAPAVSRRRPSTPFSSPAAYFLRSTASAFSPQAIISEPQREKGTSSSRHSAAMPRLPATQRRVFSVPGCVS